MKLLKAIDAVKLTRSDKTARRLKLEELRKQKSTNKLVNKYLRYIFKLIKEESSKGLYKVTTSVDDLHAVVDNLVIKLQQLGYNVYTDYTYDGICNMYINWKEA